MTTRDCFNCKFTQLDPAAFPCSNCVDGRRQEPMQDYYCAPDIIGENNGYESHYQSDHQPLEAIQANRPQEELIGFLIGNLIKYTCRFGKKGDKATEAKKIVRYANWLQKAVDGETSDPRK